MVLRIASVFWMGTFFPVSVVLIFIIPAEPFLSHPHVLYPLTPVGSVAKQVEGFAGRKFYGDVRRTIRATAVHYISVSTITAVWKGAALFVFIAIIFVIPENGTS